MKKRRLLGMNPRLGVNLRLGTKPKNKICAHPDAISYGFGCVFVVDVTKKEEERVQSVGRCIFVGTYAILNRRLGLKPKNLICDHPDGISYA